MPLLTSNNFYFVHLPDAKVQEYFSTAKSEVGNENVDSQSKGAGMSVLALL